MIGTLQSSNASSQQPRDLPISNELIPIVDELKKYLTQQKKMRDELNNLSQKPLLKLSEELTELQRAVATVTSGLQRYSTQASHLNEEVVKVEKNIGIAQRSHEAPMGLAYDVDVPINYFLSTASTFDSRLNAYKKEVEVIEQQLASRSQVSLTPKELADVLRKMDEQFIGLAAQLYTTHEDVKALTTKYKQKIRSVYRDCAPALLSDLDIPCRTSRFDTAPSRSEVHSLNRTPYGPSPFTLSSTPIAVVTQKSEVGAQPGYSNQGFFPVATSTTTAFSSGFPTVQAAPAAQPGFFGSNKTTASAFSLGMGTFTSAATTTPTPTFSGFGFPANSTALTTANVGRSLSFPSNSLLSKRQAS